MKKILFTVLLCIAAVMTACEGEDGVSAVSPTYEQPTSSDGSRKLVMSSSDAVYDLSSSSEEAAKPNPLKWEFWIGELCDEAVGMIGQLSQMDAKEAYVAAQSICGFGSERIRCDMLNNIVGELTRYDITGAAVNQSWTEAFTVFEPLTPPLKSVYIYATPCGDE